MKNTLYLLFISLLIFSCSKDKDKTSEVKVEEQTVFNYDSLWQRAEDDRVLPAITSHNSTITEKFVVQGKTYHRVVTKTGVNLCEYDGTNWSQVATNGFVNFAITKHKNTLYAATVFIQSGQKLETKVLDPATFTFTNYSQEIPSSLDDNISYYSFTTSINDTLYIIAISSTKNNISALRFNETTKTWAVVVLKHPLAGFLQHARVHEGFAGETLVSGRTADGDYVYRFNGRSFETIHKLSNFTITQSDGYFDIIPYQGKYIIADGGSGTLHYLEGMTTTSEAFPPQGNIQHFSIKENYACVAAGNPTGSAYGILKIRFYNLTNDKIAIFNPFVYQFGKQFKINAMEAPWFDYTFENGEIQMLTAARITYANFTGARAAIKLVMPVKLP